MYSLFALVQIIPLPTFPIWTHSPKPKSSIKASLTYIYPFPSHPNFLASISVSDFVISCHDLWWFLCLCSIIKSPWGRGVREAYVVSQGLTPMPYLEWKYKKILVNGIFFSTIQINISCPKAISRISFITMCLYYNDMCPCVCGGGGGIFLDSFDFKEDKDEQAWIT